MNTEKFVRDNLIDVLSELENIVQEAKKETDIENLISKYQKEIIEEFGFIVDIYQVSFSDWKICLYSEYTGAGYDHLSFDLKEVLTRYSKDYCPDEPGDIQDKNSLIEYLKESIKEIEDNFEKNKEFI